MNVPDRPFRPNVVFLDRDGTIIEDTGYISAPENVAILDGAAESIARLNRAGIPVIVATNQSGIGRGYYTVGDYLRVHARMIELLSEHGATLTAAYYCPHGPDSACDCRKPGSAMFRQALVEQKIAEGTPVFLGDRWRDIAPASELHGVGLLIPSPGTPQDEIERAKRENVLALSLSDALDRVLSASI